MNWIPSSSESGTSKGKSGLFPTPGLLRYCTLPNAPVRGLWAGEGRLFAAGGAYLFEIFAPGNPAAPDPSVVWVKRLGHIGNDAQNSPVSIFPSGDSIGIVSAGQFYIDGGLGPTAVDFSGGGPPVRANSGAFLDSYFLVAYGFTQDTNPPFDWGKGSKLVYCSNLNDGGTWDILDVATKEAYPDNVACIFADHEDLWVFGDLQSTEIWRGNGAPEGLPFQRDPSAVIHYGCGAPYSVCRADNGVAWIAGDTARGGPVAFYAQGFQPKRISNVSVEQAWSRYSDTSDAVGYSYFDRGHHYIVWSFPSGGEFGSTWCYDLTAGLWHERLFYDGIRYTRHRAACHAFVGLEYPATSGLQSARHFVGDWENGKIYTMSSDYFDDDGLPIVRLRVAPHLSNEQIYQFHHRFQLDIETGNGYLDPVLSWSDDGGHTFTEWKAASTVTPTAFGSRVLWRRLGKSRDRVYQVQVKSSVRTAIVAAYLELTPGNA